MNRCSLIQIVAIIALPLLFLSMDLQADTGTKKEKEELVARVNDTGITRADFDKALAEGKKQFARIGLPETTDGDSGQADIEQEVLDRLIDLEVMRQDGIKRGINITDALLEENFRGFLKRFATEEEFNAYLAEMDITIDELRNQVHQGLAMRQLHSQVRRELTAGITVSDTDVRKFYDDNLERFKQPEQIRASHILIEVTEDNDEEARKKARSHIAALQKKLQDGADFAELARSDSQCPTGSEGGGLGFFARGTMDESFENAAFALNPGEVSDIVASRFGYHLIKLEEKKPEGTVAFTDVKDNIADFLSQNRLEQAQAAYVKELRDKAKITILLDAQ